MDRDLQRSGEKGSSEAKGFPGSGRFVPVVFLALLLWVVGAVIFAALSQGSSGRTLTTMGVYWLAAIFALGASGYRAWISGGGRRAFWALVCGALLARFCGYLWWFAFGRSFTLVGVAPQELAYLLSYVAFFLALLYLVAATTRGIAPLSPLDALMVMGTAGLLVWYFVLGPSAAVAAPEGYREIAVNLFRPVVDAGLLFLGLVALSSIARPPFTGWVVGAFGAFLAADLVYVVGHSFEPSYEWGRWPEMFWALGVVLVGIGALHRSSGELSPQVGDSPWKALCFWCGPLSPAVQYAFLLAWATLHPPIPSYVSWGGVGLALYFGLRVSVLTYVNRQLRLEGQRQAKREEQGRISGELHDTLKQSVHSTSLLLGAYKRARDKGDEGAAQKALEGAMVSAREANHRVSRPVEELRTLCESPQADLDDLLGDISEDLRGHFEIKIHQDLRADLCALGCERLGAAQRIVGEALWNAARHSGAKNVRVISREVGSVVLVKVSDDGRGISGEDASAGVGISLMRERAEAAGAGLDLISPPTGGATVQVRFEK